MVGSDSLSRLSDSTLPSLRGTLKSTRTMTRLPVTGRSSTKSFFPVLMGAGFTSKLATRPSPLPMSSPDRSERDENPAAARVFNPRYRDRLFALIDDAPFVRHMGMRITD